MEVERRVGRSSLSRSDVLFSSPRTPPETLGITERCAALEIISAGLSAMLWDNDRDDDRRRLERVAAWLRARAVEDGERAT